MNNHIKPTIGRIVYHRNLFGETRAAIVAKVLTDSALNLYVIGPAEDDAYHGLQMNVPYGEADKDFSFSTWDWMPYQKEQAAKKEEAVSGSVGGTIDADRDREYYQRHQREQAMHMAITARQTHDNTREVLDAAEQFLAFMKGE